MYKYLRLLTRKSVVRKNFFNHISYLTKNVSFQLVVSVYKNITIYRVNYCTVYML